MGDAQIGKDVVLREKEPQTRLVQLLPKKAQLGFSSLKEHFSQRNDSGMKRFLQNSKPHDPIKLEYTCIDATENFIALGCNFGILFFYDRNQGRLQRFVAESKQIPIVCVKILPSQNFVVTGQFNGALTIFNYGKEKDGNYKVLLKCTVDDHHHTPVTCVEWTPDGTKLFSGDSEGNVAISVINMDNGQTHTVFICKEDSPITQLSLCSSALLVSTLRRSLIWPFTLKTPVQVGQQERKVQGSFGACFYPKLHDQSSNGHHTIYAARPGLRIWRANIEGKVSTTMIFKESISKGEPEISTLNLPSSLRANGVQTEPRQFGPLIVFATDFLLSWQGSCIWVLEPSLGVIAGCHSNFGSIVGVATCNNELFVLSRSEEQCVRRIVFENRSQSPIIEVKELSFQEDEIQAKIPRTGSVHQFEENDKIDKIIGGVMSTTVGFISGVKRNVVKTIEQIKTRDDSDENSSSSSGETHFSIDPSSPITIIRGKDANGFPNAGSYSDGETFSTSITSPCVIKTPPKREIGDGHTDDQPILDGITPLPTDESSENQAPNFQNTADSQNGLEAEEVDYSEEREIKVTIKHDLREKETPFQHISKRDFNSDIVFEGTSKRKPRKKKKLDKANKDQCESSDDDKPIIRTDDMIGIVNGDVGLESNTSDEMNSRAKEIVDRPAEITDSRGEIVDHARAELTNANAIETYVSREGNKSTLNEKAKDIERNTADECSELERIKCNDSSQTAMKSQINYICKKEKDLPTTEFGLNNDDGNETNVITNEVIVSKADDTENTGNPTSVTPASLALEPNDNKQADTDAKRADTWVFEADKKAKEALESRVEYEPPFDPSEVLNVEIAPQEPNKSMQAGEPCKKVQGEAVERTHARTPSNSGCLFVGQEDNIDSNILWIDEDDERIELDYSPPHSPVGSEHSLFPAPQMNYHSIYSQDTVSLSEISFSEPEHDAPTTRKYIDDNDCIDSLAMLSIDSNDLTDIEDNRCHSPPINLDHDGGVELTEASLLQHKYLVGSSKGSTKDSNCSSPSAVEIDTPLPMSPHSVAEKVSERLRLLADSWADIPIPSSASIQSIAVTDTLVWCVDHREHLFVTQSASANVNWKKVDGKVKQISANQSGKIIWGVNLKKVALCRTNVKPNNPQGSDWETVETEVLEIAVDDSCVWGIRTNGDVFIRNGVSPSKPEGTGARNIRVASDLVHITALGSMVWGLDIYNHVQIYQGDLSSLGGNEQSLQWLELPGIIASFVSLGPKGVCWIIDTDGKIWFNLEISEHNFFGGKWYQLSIGEYLVQDPSVLSSVVSFFKRGNEPKILAGNDISGIWILSKHGTLHAARGHLLGTRWDLTVPIAMSSSTFWTCVSSQGATGNGGFIWALQPNGDLHCFRPESKSFVVQPPPKTTLKFISASPRSLWALSNTQDVYMRKGISETAPQGLKWMNVDMSSMGSERICNIACGILVVWAVDFHGNVWFQMGKEDARKFVYSPAWIQVEGSPFDGCRFTKVAVGSNDCTVWAIDDRNNVYARRDVTESFLIGTAWEVVAGTGAKDITISDHLVWALCPNGDIVCRFGISSINFVGDYWKTVPGRFEQVSVSADDELWGIDRQGQLYQRQTLNFFGTQVTRKVPSYSQLFLTDDDWELI